jgi:hypothetical protein
MGIIQTDYLFCLVFFVGSASLRFQGRSTTYMTKLILGIIGGLVLAGIAWAGENVFDPQHQYHRLWLILSLLALPVMALGMIYLAKWRGYPGEAGLVLLGFGILVHVALTHLNRKPLVDALGILFEVALPMVVILALPVREMPFQKPLKQVRKNTPRPG